MKLLCIDLKRLMLRLEATDQTSCSRELSSQQNFASWLRPCLRERTASPVVLAGQQTVMSWVPFVPAAWVSFMSMTRFCDVRQYQSDSSIPPASKAHHHTAAFVLRVCVVVVCAFAFKVCCRAQLAAAAQLIGALAFAEAE